MQPLPHRYSATAYGEPTGNVVLNGAGVQQLHSAAPAQFGGPGDQWSPEALLIAAVADCFILTFRAVAHASNVSWTSLRCYAVGRLDRVNAITRFTEITLRAHLTVPPDTDTHKARRLVDKAESGCLISNSLAVRPLLTCSIEVAVAGQLDTDDEFPANVDAEFAREWRS